MICFKYFSNCGVPEDKSLSDFDICERNQFFLKDNGVIDEHDRIKTEFILLSSIM